MGIPAYLQNNDIIEHAESLTPDTIKDVSNDLDKLHNKTKHQFYLDKPDLQKNDHSISWDNWKIAATNGHSVYCQK